MVTLCVRFPVLLSLPLLALIRKYWGSEGENVDSAIREIQRLQEAKRVR